MTVFRIGIDYENNAEIFWDNGGRELWKEFAGEKDFVDLNEEKKNEFIERAKKIKGYDDGPEYAKTPFCVMEAECVNTKKLMYSLGVINAFWDYASGQILEAEAHKVEEQILNKSKPNSKKYVKEIRSLIFGRKTCQCSLNEDVGSFVSCGEPESDWYEARENIDYIKAHFNRIFEYIESSDYVQRTMLTFTKKEILDSLEYISLCLGRCEDDNRKNNENLQVVK